MSIFLCIFSVIKVIEIPIVAENSQSSSTEQKVVRVGWYEDSYHITGQNGTLSGYGYEFEQAVASYTGWKYEYVKGDFSELLDKLANGEIDMMAALSYTDERAKTMLFSEQPMGEEKYYLYADLQHTDISPSDLSTLNGKRIVVMESSVQATQFSQWEEENHVQTQHINMDSFEKAKEAASKREIDGVISTETPAWVEAGMSAIAITGGSGIYYGINKNRSDLKEELDSAMRSMEQDKPFYSDDLYKEYLATQSVAVLSKEEKSWLSNHEKIRIGCLKNDGGFSSLSPNGTIVGAVDDYIDSVKKNLNSENLKFEIVGFDSQDKQIQALQNGEIDFIFHFTQNPYIAEQNNLILSNTVFSLNMTAITTQNYFDESKEHVVAVKQDDLLLKWYITYNYLNWKIVTYSSEAEVEQAVKNGEVDCFVAQTSQATNYIDDNKWVVVNLSKSGNTAFATKRNNTTMMAILNKSLKTISTSMLSGALSMHENVLKKVTVIDYIKDNLLQVACIVFVVVGLILLIVLNYLKKSKLAEAKANQLNEQLQDALGKAESANKAKTAFLNNMSHDIRTPMNAIIGFTNIALKQNVNEGVKNCLEKISDSSEMLLTLINDVLDISRIESGNVQYSPVTVDICSVADKVLNVTNGLLSNRNINFVVERAQPIDSYVKTDPIRIREILINILSNAIKFTDDGGTVTFHSEILPADDTHILIRYTITDTGIGMSEDYLTHIFDEFSQEYSGARTKYKGTGLGMAITKSYVDLLGGSIVVHSKKGKGTQFAVELPLEIVPEEQIVNSSKKYSARDIAGLHVLLAEDNDLNAEIATIQLENAGMKVIRVDDGEKAVECFMNHPVNTFDIILMDVMMPNMNGYEATKRIRQQKNRPDGKTIPIVALTANAFAEDIQSSMEAGMDDHLSKPFSEDDLLKTIMRNMS